MKRREPGRGRRVAAGRPRGGTGAAGAHGPVPGRLRAPGRRGADFAEYVPVVAAAVSAGTRRAYGSYWNRIVDHWGDRRLDEPTPSEIQQLWPTSSPRRRPPQRPRRPQRGGAPLAALRCLYRHAVDDGLISEADNPARKVAKPRRLPSTRRAVPDPRLAEINQVAATTGTTPSWTRCCCGYTETACRRGGALALRPPISTRPSA